MLHRGQITEEAIINSMLSLGQPSRASVTYLEEKKREPDMKSENENRRAFGKELIPIILPLLSIFRYSMHCLPQALHTALMHRP